MARIFTTLAAFNIVAFVAAFVTGFVSQLQRGGPQQQETAYVIHFVLGLVAVLANLLVHCLIITYFLGTGRLIKEATLAYGLADERWARPTRDIKRNNTPKAILAMLLSIAVAAAGEGDRHNVWPWSVHLVLALLVVVVNLWVFRVEYRNVTLNGRLLDGMIGEIERIRAERGLPSSAEALEEARAPHR
jgi:cytochrome b561